MPTSAPRSASPARPCSGLSETQAWDTAVSPGEKSEAVCRDWKMKGDQTAFFAPSSRYAKRDPLAGKKVTRLDLHGNRHQEGLRNPG